jgi:hypothetical protein
MNRLFILLLCFSLLASSCNNNKSKETAGDTAKDSAALKDAEVNNKMKDAVLEAEKVKDELSKLTPLTIDQLKAFIPESLMGAKRISVDANTSAGAGMAVGEYAINDSMKVVLSVFDCAGPGGSGIYSQQYLGLENSLQQTEEEYTKSIEVNSNKGYEQCDKTVNECAVTFFTANRYLVSLQGTKVGAPALREAASQLRIQ